MTKNKQRKLDAAIRDRYIRGVARVHIIKSELGLDRDVYEDILEGLIGRRTVKDAAPRELRLVINRLEAAKKSLNSMPNPHQPVSRQTAPPPAARETGRTKGRYKAQGKRGDGGQHPTTAQLSYIAFLEDKAGWVDNPARLLGFVRRQAGGTNYTVESMPRWLVSKVITGLEALTGYTPESRRKQSAKTSA